jgi:neopullulanase
MLARVRTVLLALLCLIACGVVSAQTNCLTATGPAPCIDNIDPPNWWATFPSPMLLLHGNHLSGASVAISGSHVSVSRTHASANGHYLFVWLRTTGAAPQTITLHVTSDTGSASRRYHLDHRKPVSAGFQGFSSSDVMYLIMTDRFADGDTANDPHPSQRALPRGWHGGDLRGIQQHLDYLKQLGITTIWTTPIYDNTGGTQDYHGYSATNMYAVDPHFGTLADYIRLAHDVHADGMKLVLDTVPNHVGAANPWAKDPPTPDWFHGTVAHHDVANGDFTSLPDPHASWAQQKDVTQGWFANVLPDLNQENPLVSQYLIQNAVWWVETAGLDGLRLDTFPYVSREFWHNFHAQLHQLFPHLTTVGEVFNPDPTIVSYFAGGEAHPGHEGTVDTGLYTPFDFPMYLMLRKVLIQNQPMSDLESVLRQDRLYPHPNRLVTFIGNHDTMRFMGVPGATDADLKMAFALISTLRGMPQIYSGDEIAMRGGNDPDNRHDFPGGFPADSANAFTASGRTPEQQSVHHYLRTLLHFRAQHLALQTGLQQDIYMDKTVFAFVRSQSIEHGCTPLSPERVLVIANHSAVSRTLTLSTPETALTGCSQFTPELGASHATLAHGSLTIQLAPDQTAIYLVH